MIGWQPTDSVSTWSHDFSYVSNTQLLTITRIFNVEDTLKIMPEFYEFIHTYNCSQKLTSTVGGAENAGLEFGGPNSSAAFSNPAFSSPAIWSAKFQSCIFQPCYLVYQIPVLHFPPLLFGLPNSSPAFSTFAIWSAKIQSCIFHPRFPMVRHLPVLHFQSPPTVAPFHAY